MPKQSVEVQVTAVAPLTDDEDPTSVAEELLGQLRNAVQTTFRRVDLNTVTLREGRKVLQRLNFRRPR